MNRNCRRCDKLFDNEKSKAGGKSYCSADCKNHAAADRDEARRRFAKALRLRARLLFVDGAAVGKCLLCGGIEQLMPADKPADRVPTARHLLLRWNKFTGRHGKCSCLAAEAPR